MNGAVGDLAVNPYALRRLDARRRRHLHQRAIDEFPGRWLDGSNDMLECRLLRTPMHRQARKRLEARRVPQIERQLVIAQLPMLLEHSAAQHRLRRQPAAPGRLQAPLAQVVHHRRQHAPMGIEPLRHRLQLAPQFMIEKHFVYSDLGRAFLARSPSCGVADRLENQWYEAPLDRDPPGVSIPRDKYFLTDQYAAVSGRTLISMQLAGVA